MKIQELFFKSLDRSINGVVKADQNDAATVYQELDEYVVTKELEKHFRSFFQVYGTDLSDPSLANKAGVWISGFFGSGKSHFLKILSYVLANKATYDEQGNSRLSADFFDENKITDAFIRADIVKAVRHQADVILFNIDSKVNANDDGDPILNVFLRVFNEHQGFNADHPHIAHLERHLTKKGVYEQFKQAFEMSSGETWLEVRDAFHFYQDDIQSALAQVLDLSAESAEKWFADAEKNFSVSVENFCQWVKEYLETQDAQKRILFLVDEVGQFIGNDTRLMLRLQTITENLGTMCQGRAWIIVTSQADMDAVLGEMTSSKANDFSKITGRFKTRLSLSSSNTDEVIQKRLLRKTDAAAAELQAVFEQKGDILKNQLSFDRSGPTLKNFDGDQSFVANYPFAPYHFQLVQKVFEQIRKVGATGAHLAYGERSMLDAFQMAARSVSAQEIGVLVPFSSFYKAIEGFLDPAVKRTIDQAAANPVLEPVDTQILQTLFMIRYVDIVKGTLDNLVTLSIEKIDEDKLALRQRLEVSLQRLEKESLITRNGDEFLFLTNEERDITKKIKATDLSSSEENRKLSQMLFKDLLRDQTKYRYALNKADYTLGRYLDGHAIDNRLEHDLKIQIISPLDVDYKSYDEGKCILYSGEEAGQIVFKLPDDFHFFNELRISLKTEKYIRTNNDGSQPDISKILGERARENQEREKRLKINLEQMLLNASCYVQGQVKTFTSPSLQTRLDEACGYLLQNTYTKLDYIQKYQDDPWRELRAVLYADDVTIAGLNFEDSRFNPKAVREIEDYIALRSHGTERIYAYEVVEHFNKRPFGWTDGEILLILGQLAVAGRITFDRGSSTAMGLKEAFPVLENSRQRREVVISQKKQTDERLLRQAKELAKDLFASAGANSEKELHQLYVGHFNTWLSHLKNYQSKAETGKFPGKSFISAAILTLQRMLASKDSYHFFKDLIGQEDQILDLEEDYRNVHEFYTNQIHVWQQLLQALHVFEKNRSALIQDQQTMEAWGELNKLSKSETPYKQLHQVNNWISKVEAVNERLLTDKRKIAVAALDLKVNQLTHEIQKSGLETPHLSNQLLSPLQNLKNEINQETGLGNLHVLQTQRMEDLFDEALAQLEHQIAIHNTPKPVPAEATVTTSAPAEPKASPVSAAPPPQPKQVVEVQVGSVYAKTINSIYLEDEASIERFIRALEDELKSQVRAEKRVRIR